MTMLALRYLGTGDFKALHPARADKELVIGEVMRWVPFAERSPESHRHLFKVIADAWANLPERLADEFPSPETLRKWALIEAGHCTVTHLAFANNGEAQKALALMREMDGYSQVGINDKVIVVKRAKSIAYMAVRKREDFQVLKDKVFHALSVLTGADIAQHAEEAA